MEQCTIPHFWERCRPGGELAKNVSNMPARRRRSQDGAVRDSAFLGALPSRRRVGEECFEHAGETPALPGWLDCGTLFR